MADGDARADGQRQAGVAVADRAVLDIAVLADEDRRVVGADDGAEPDAGPLAQPDVADEVGRGRGPRPSARVGATSSRA